MTDTKPQIWTLEALRVYRDEILSLAAHYGAFNLRIFGSVARGEAKPNSDIDFLVQFPPDYKLLDQAGLLMDLQTLLGVKVDVSIENNLREAYRKRILQEAIPL